MTFKTSDKAIVRELTEVLAAKGLRHAVISPGSRNAPLIISFSQHSGIQTYSIVDERSAAYFAMGLAHRLQEPVAIICTSGTAALNLAPALSEAFYQQIPLIAITADRPAEWIDQADGQAIRQQHMYANFCKAWWQLPVSDSQSDIWYANRVANEAFNLCMHPRRGPVHLNVPLREPLYGQTDGGYHKLRIIHEQTPELMLTSAQKLKVNDTLKNTRKVMVLCGTLSPNLAEGLASGLLKFAALPSVVVFTESTSNLFHPLFRTGIDRMITSLSPQAAQMLQPDLLITVGTNLVSKRIKTYLREFPPAEHWHIEIADSISDTFQMLTHHFVVEMSHFFEYVNALDVKVESTYAAEWNLLDTNTLELHNKLMPDIQWSDLKVFHTLFKSIPADANIHLGNSTPVRYGQLFHMPGHNFCFSNRGTSGIDGCVSTAIGYAFADDAPNWLIIGDISFIYDSNALWNNYLGPNLRVVIINNQGGSIFRYIPGPDTTSVLEDFFETPHHVNIEQMVQSYGFDCISANNQDELSEQLKLMTAPREKPLFLVVHTPRMMNAQILKHYFNKIKPTV